VSFASFAGSHPDTALTSAFTRSLTEPNSNSAITLRASSLAIRFGTVGVVLEPPTAAAQTGIGKRLDTDQAMGDETLEFEAGRVMAEETAGPLGITGTGRSS
jgi:hypothetical protein